MTQTQQEKQVTALMESFTTHRAVYYALRESFPHVAKMAAESAANLMLAFPVLRELESMIRIGEEEFSIAKSDQPGGLKQ